MVDLKSKYYVVKDKVHIMPTPPNCWESYTGLQPLVDSPPAGKEKCKECFERPYSKSLPVNPNL